MQLVALNLFNMAHHTQIYLNGKGIFSLLARNFIRYGELREMTHTFIAQISLSRFHKISIIHFEEEEEKKETPARRLIVSSLSPTSEITRPDSDNRIVIRGEKKYGARERERERADYIINFAA